MAQKQSSTNLSTLLFSFLNQKDPMLSMLKWLCKQMMEADVSTKLNADKSERSDSRSGYRSGYRTRTGNDLSYGSKGSSGRIYSVLCERVQTK